MLIGTLVLVRGVDIADARPSAQTAAPEASALALRVPIESALAPGESRSYSIDLAAGDYLFVTVRQEAIDIALRVYRPDGARALEVDGPTGKYGTERARFVADAGGTYRVEVASLEKGVPAGRYEIEVRDLRPATDADRVRIDAQSAYLDGIRLRLVANADSLRQAIDRYAQSVDLWKSVGETLEAGAVLNDLGFAYRLLSDFPHALAAYEESLRLRESIDDGPGAAQALTNLGATAYFLGEGDKAYDQYTRALRLRQAEGNPQEEALLLSNLGEVFAWWGENQRALDAYREALSIEERVGDRLRQSITLSDTGMIYSSAGQYATALDLFEAALRTARDSGNRRVEGRILDNIGTAYRELGDRAHAEAAYDEALALYRALGNRVGESEALDAVGVMALRSGDYDAAMTRFGEALALQRALGNRRDTAATLGNIGSVLLARGELPRAQAAFEESLSLRREVQDRPGEAQSRFGLARVYRARGDLDASLAASQLAVDIVETMRTAALGQEMRTSYLATTVQVYEFAIDTLMTLDRSRPGRGFAAAALQMSERARARSLLEGLSEARARIRRGVSDDLRARERSLQDRINRTAERQTQLLNGRHAPEDAARLAREMRDLLASLQALEAEIRERSPRYADLTRARPLDVAAIQRDALDAGTVLLEYALGADRSYMWAVSVDSIDSFVLPPRGEVEALARRVYRSIASRNTLPAAATPAERRRLIASADADFGDAARALSRMLLAPIGRAVEGKRLVIVADGALQYVPFGVLPAPTADDRAAEAEPLIVAHEIVAAPSASTIAALRRDADARHTELKPVAIIADPVFSPDDPRLGAHGPAAATPGDSDMARSASDVGISGFRRLRFSRDEADAIASLAAPAERFEATGFRASRDTALSPDLARFGTVHFSTHGILDSTHPELSGLVLSLYDDRGRPQDGFLRLHDIYNLELNAALVVLSACETALGPAINGEGLIGLARGFMYAGAPRVVASLWNVEDQATATLMKRFYADMMADGHTPAAALRAAQISMWKERRWAAPYYWAAFVLEGEWR
ncbi:MAG TPA: CHAT domain-containing protein [Vicinamibacterales bacterium]|nr:CHAT domain-containing protein [Vicinamibacterales bacterium]